MDLTKQFSTAPRISLFIRRDNSLWEFLEIGQIVSGLDIFGIEAERLLKLLASPDPVASLDQDYAQVIVRLGLARIHPQRLLILLLGHGELARPKERITEFDVRGNQIGIELQRLRKLFHRVRISSGLLQGLPQIKMRVSIIGVAP